MNYICLKIVLILIVSLSAIDNSFSQQTVKPEHKVEYIYPPFQQFYSKYLTYSGIPIRSAEVVSNSALYVATDKLHIMLQHVPIIRENLIANGVELHIIGRNQQTSDLPEFKSRKNVQYEDYTQPNKVNIKT